MKEATFYFRTQWAAESVTMFTLLVTDREVMKKAQKRLLKYLLKELRKC